MFMTILTLNDYTLPEWRHVILKRGKLRPGAGGDNAAYSRAPARQGPSPEAESKGTRYVPSKIQLV